jgi:hypothetical protein
MVSVVPMCYGDTTDNSALDLTATFSRTFVCVFSNFQGAFTAWVNLVWAMLAWKVFGFTEVPSESSCFDLMRSYSESLNTRGA